MKKLFFLPLLVLTLLATSCQKEELIQNIYQGSYVYTEYCDVAYNQWEASLVPVAPGSSIWKTDCLTFTYSNPNITRDVVENSFVTCYVVDEYDRDVSLPWTRYYTDPTGADHEYQIRYVVELGKVTFIIDAKDKNYDYIIDYLPDNMAFKVCMVMN